MVDIVLFDVGCRGIVLNRKPWQSAEVLQEPLNELKRCLEISLGTSLEELHPRSRPTTDTTISLVWDPTLPWDLEEFQIEAQEGEVSLRAKSLAGSFHAVYWFLEKAIGARWLWPGTSGEVIPSHEQVRFPAGSFRDKPSFNWRRIGLGGPLLQGMDYRSAMASYCGVDDAYLEAFDRWCRRNRLGGLQIADGHRWAEIAPVDRYAARHPEVYALVNGERDLAAGDGKHGNQPCLTHPKTIDVMASYAAARLESMPQLDGVSIALNDGGEQCQCERCKAFDASIGATEIYSVEHFDRVTDETQASPAPTEHSVTDRVIWNANQVHERTAGQFPAKKLLILLYAQYRRPPIHHQLHDAVVGQYCVQSHSFWHDHTRTVELDRLRTMAQFVPSLGIYDYHSQGDWLEAHRVFPGLVESATRSFYEAGARYYATQPTTGFAAQGLNLYVLARCLWDVNASASQIVRAFFEAGFGGASPHVERFFHAFSERWKTTESGTRLPAVPLAQLSVAHLYPLDFLNERQRELDAARATDVTAEIQTRIAFVEAGLRHTTLLCQAAASLLALYAQVGQDDRKLPRLDHPCGGRALAAKALQACDRHWDFVEKHTGQFIFGDFWVRYRSVLAPHGQLYNRLVQLAERTPLTTGQARS